jgi:Protein kinase domain/FHA domain
MSGSSQTAHSPPAAAPWGRLVPCVPSMKLTALDFKSTQNEYWLGRSSKCDVTAQVVSETNLSKKERTSLDWGKSMISNRHCRIFWQQTQNGAVQVYVEDNSGNGTFINQQTHLRKGENRILHSGDEICLVNVETLRKTISSHRILQMVLQQFSFIFVQCRPRKPCVNPRAMNYSFAAKQLIGGVGGNAKNNSKTSPRSTRRIETIYDIREVLGDGTSGQVRRAIHRRTGEECAVKIISLRRQLDMTIMEREVSLLQSLDHPYVVQLMDVFVHHGVAMYLVMELVKGGDLFDRIVEKQRYTEVEARRAMRRLLSAVHYLHEQKNIVHRYALLCLARACMADALYYCVLISSSHDPNCYPNSPKRSEAGEHPLLVPNTREIG